MNKEDKVFQKHPSLKKYYKTSDGTAFYKKEHAQAHGRGLGNNSVEEVVNPDPKAVSFVPAKKLQDESKKSSKGKNLKSGENLTNTNGKLDDLNPMQKAKLRVREIEKLATVSEVEAALKGETAPSVIKAGETRIKAIQEVDKVLDEKSKEEEE